GTELFNPSLQGTELFNPSLQGTELFNPSLQGTELFNPSLQGTELLTSSLQGTSHPEAKEDRAWIRVVLNLGLEHQEQRLKLESSRAPEFIKVKENLRRTSRDLNQDQDQD
ncbi:hypothetical protein WMY93_034055, partial [Mugilogobius chulae]